MRPATFLVAALLALPGAAAAESFEQAAAVDAAVVLAADVSGSIDEEEFDLQRRGYATAIASEQVLEAIRTGPHGAIALSLVEWAGETEQKVVVDWAVIRNEADARQFADTLLAAPRPYLGSTAIGSAIDFAMNVLGERWRGPERHVIDISGDGMNNHGRLVTDARDAALKAGVVINGLAIYNRLDAADIRDYVARHSTQPGGLAQYYKDNVIGGPGAFVVTIDDFKSFGGAMTRKLITEIADAGTGGDTSRFPKSASPGCTAGPIF